MKKVIILALIIATTLGACRKKGNPNAGLPPSILVDTTTIEILEGEYNFGKIKQGEKVTHIFKVKNTGDNNLIIGNAIGSCGCTVPEYPREPVPKGAIADIKVTFNSEGKQGEQRKSVTLQVNTKNRNELLYLVGEVLVDSTKK